MKNQKQCVIGYIAHSEVFHLQENKNHIKISVNSMHVLDRKCSIDIVQHNSDNLPPLSACQNRLC